MSLVLGEPEMCEIFTRTSVVDTDDRPQHGRFAFGKNWRRFLARVDTDSIDCAKRSLGVLLSPGVFAGKRFLDVGSGSGLFSLAARSLGARVYSFDVDPQSVRCTEELKHRFFSGDGATDWVVAQGSVLDREFLKRLGQFDIVYAWGVLHHTGAMWQALENVAGLVASDGFLVLAIYNDQGRTSRRWRRIKRAYNRLPRPWRFLILWPAFARLWGPTTVRDFLCAKPFQTWRDYAQNSRGMDPWRDVVDWVGGYPFEVAKPEDVANACRQKDLQLLRLQTCAGGRGCNEFVFRRTLTEASGTGVLTGGSGVEL